MRGSVFKGVILGVVAATLLSVGWWLWRDARPVPAADPVAAFLAGHWHKPLAAQGVPPARFTPLEASLSPEACGQCHSAQLRDWRSSLHSRTMGHGILWQVRALAPEQVKSCLDCHAPLAEQKALLARELGWPNAPANAPPDYVAPGLHRQGLVCAACHVRSHRRYGPPPATDKAPEETPKLSHGGYQASAAFQDSRFCVTCHQFPDDGPALNGKPLENTFNEWRTSRHAAEGRSCQACHMPERRHLWRGIHDPDMLRQALSGTLSVLPTEGGALRVRAEIHNSGAGHYFPTYLVPRVKVRLVSENSAGTQRHLLAATVFARATDIWLTEERSDTRLPPDATSVLEATLMPPNESGWRLRLYIDVAPRAHYERMFAAVLRDNSAQLDVVTRELLNTALAEARASRYSLALMERELPQAIAN